MRATTLFIGLWPVTLVLCGAATGQDKYFLDLTIPEAVDRSLEDDVGWGGGVGSSSPPEFPLAVELKSVDKETYAVGSDVLIYEVRITNTGKTKATIPWTPRRALVWNGYRPGKRLSGLEATVGLEIVARDSIIPLDAKGLYSKLDDPKTFILLGPEESAVVKARFRIVVDPNALVQTKNKCGQLSSRLTLRVSFNLTDWSQGKYYKRLESKSLTEIVLKWNENEK